MSRSVTVVFGNGETHVYENVPLDITPDQVEERATRDFPGQPVREIMGIDILYRDLRNAIASRTATMEDLDRIAGQYGRRIDDKDRGTFQTWVDYAASNPDAPIPENIFTPLVSRTEAVATGATQGVQNVANFLPRIAAWAADRFGLTPANSAAWVAENMLGYSREEAENIRRNLSRSDIGSFGEVVSAGRQSLRERPEVLAAQAQRPNWFTLGDIGGGIATTAPFLAGLGASAVRLAPSLTPVSPTLSRIVERGGQAVVAGGFSPTATTRGGRLAQRVFGGGTTAAIPAAITAEEPTAGGIATEAAIGAAIPIIGTIARQGAGYAYDLLRRRVGEVRAGEIMRNLIAENADAIMAALRSAPADARTNTAEFLASRGLMTPELAAATRIVQSSTENAPLLATAQARAAGQEEARAVLRGGATGTEAMQNIGAMRRDVQTSTDPLREEALRRADVGRVEMIPQERAAQIEDAIAAEINRSGIVGRMRGLEDRSREQLNMMFQSPFFTLGGPAARTGEIADQAGRRADEGIEAQLALRDSAAARREAIENLRAQGLQPLDISGVVGDLRRKAADAEFVNPARHRLLSSFADNLQSRAQMMGGVIDATGLYELRKSMGDTVSQLLGPIDPAALQRRTAELVGEVRPLIDDAIEAAGGTGWRNYLNRFSEGMQQVERQQFGRMLADLPENRFESVMAGNDPDFVSKFFGPGNYDINAVLSEAQLPVAQRLAGEIGASRDVSSFGLRNLPASVRGGLPSGLRRRVIETMEPGLGPMSRAVFNVTGRVPGLSGGGIAAEQTAREISERLSRNAMRSLAPGLAEPSEALRLVGVRPTNAMTADMFNYMGPQTRAFMAQTIQNMVNQPSQIYELPPEMLPPEDQSFMGFQTGPNGEQIPIYAPTRVQR
jgi:hypothetical protein